jgi:hypothetical protein
VPRPRHKSPWTRPGWSSAGRVAAAVASAAQQIRHALVVAHAVEVFGLDLSAPDRERRLRSELDRADSRRGQWAWT